MDWHKLLCYLLLSTFILFTKSTFASPIGLWQTYDLSRTPRDIVKISENDGQLIGTIVKPAQKIATCSACEGHLHDKPLNGMKIIWGLTQQGNSWKNGHVLNIDNGKTYQCYLTISNNNKILHFSPYVGTPLLGVTLDWIRIE